MLTTKDTKEHQGFLAQRAQSATEKKTHAASWEGKDKTLTTDGTDDTDLHGSEKDLKKAGPTGYSEAK